MRNFQGKKKPQTSTVPTSWLPYFSSLFESGPMQHLFNDIFESVQPETKKPDIVEVVRYFRDWDYDIGQISSTGGMTAICQLDYINMKLIVYPAFCIGGDNFSKTEGLKAATKNKERGAGFVFPLHRKLSIYDNIMQGINNEEDECYSDYADKKLADNFSIWYHNQ